EQGLTPSQYLITDETRHFSFLVQDGVYYISAFEDTSSNFIYEESEICGYYGSPDGIIANAKEKTVKDVKQKPLLDIELKQSCKYPAVMPRDVADGSFAVKSFKKLGVVTDLDNSLFDQKNGSLGYWKPLSFLKDVGVGIYFLEPYDPDKIPVLFVHGAVGTPVGWQPIVDQLDRQRYQPWFYYYPSGLRLDTIAGALNTLITELSEKHHFETLHIIAHSMGGLVSRDFIIKNVIEEQQTYIDKFISMSTPWGGVGTAALGVKKAPAVVPSWYDVAPDSDFLEHLYKDPLPEKVEFYLLFGVRGKCSMMMKNNDGTVEIASEIDHRAQADAAGFYGFDEDHMSILTSDRVIKQILKLMNTKEQ
ncbi:MAG: alpha/beta hydrolase, partial [Thermodesulfobacteriota bacterium]|nr:alpha/beta hydrolase [Thermodesulfobacteriota bacterium]